MWRVLFYIAVLVAVSKASPPQYPIAVPFEHETSVLQDVNLFDKIGTLRDRFSLALSKLIARFFLRADPRSQQKVKWGKPKSCPSCLCGYVGTYEKLIGVNEDINAHKYPWMALLILKDNDEMRCGASLINDKYVLTSARCLSTSNPSDYKVRLSVHDRHTDISEEYNVKKVITHEALGYNDGQIMNDIALIRLDTDGVKMSTYLRPVCMPKKGLSYDNVIGVAPKWDWSPSVDGTNRLREVEYQTLSNRECNQYGRPLLTESTFCAGLRDMGKDAMTSCDAEIGGPLTVANGSVHHLVGIMPAVPNHECRYPPAVFTRVSEYLDWIKANTADACPCYNN